MGPGADKHVRARGIVVCSAGVECGIEAWRGGIGERRAWQVAWVGVSGGEGGAPSCCCWSACKVTQLESSSKTSSPAQQSMPLTLESAGNHSDRRSAANASGSRPTHASTSKAGQARDGASSAVQRETSSLRSLGERTHARSSAASSSAAHPASLRCERRRPPISGSSRAPQWERSSRSSASWRRAGERSEEQRARPSLRRWGLFAQSSAAAASCSAEQPLRCASESSGARIVGRQSERQRERRRVARRGERAHSPLTASSVSPSQPVAISERSISPPRVGDCRLRQWLTSSRSSDDAAAQAAVSVSSPNVLAERSSSFRREPERRGERRRGHPAARRLTRAGHRRSAPTSASSVSSKHSETFSCLSCGAARLGRRSAEQRHTESSRRRGEPRQRSSTAPS
mmetsp:Transcript_31804/g.103968  ORF Transcript_31804/g.103968 Transcript_31804/m.103968 type:complete len:401 (-) Transcript_31804:634-1836(-)